MEEPSATPWELGSVSTQWPVTPEEAHFSGNPSAASLDPRTLGSWPQHSQLLLLTGPVPRVWARR